MILSTPRKLNGFDKAILILNCILSLALLLSYLAPFANPEDFWIVALLGLAYQFLLLINIVFVVYWLFRSRIYMLISGLIILSGFKIILANFGFHLPVSVTNKASAGDIRIMAYNVHGFGGFDKSQGKSIQTDIMKLIDDKGPDVINIEEFYEDVSTRKSIFSSLKKVMKSDNFYFRPYDYTQWDSTGVAVFSRYPIVNRGEILSPDKEQIQAIYVDLKKGNSIFRDYCVHLQSTHFDDSEHQYLKSLTEHGKVSVTGLHLITSKLKLAYIKRSYQVALIKQSMSQCPYPYVIAGDFNDTPISFSVNQIQSGLKNAFIEKGSGLGITYYGDFPHFQIDYILTSKQFNIDNYQIIEKKLSDHYPIMSDLNLNPVKQ